MKRFPLLAVLTIFLAVITAYAAQGDGTAGEGFCFAVLADPRDGGETWRNALQEIHKGNGAVNGGNSRTELIVVAGDMDPLDVRYEDYRQVFSAAVSRPVFLPVIGNHEFENGGAHFRFARDIIIPALPGARRRHPTSCDYYLDHRNVRIIAVDGYTDLGRDGVISAEGRHWVEQVIRAAPPGIQHIFVTFHEPAFPRFRHKGDSFDQDPQLRNDFWRMLLRYRDRVRAVLVGHTHNYYRMRVLDPAKKAARKYKKFPDDEGGIYQIDAGAAGNGPISTIVQICIKGSDVRFRTLQAKAGAHQPFSEVDYGRITIDP